jgi:hypothetical protein
LHNAAPPEWNGPDEVNIFVDGICPHTAHVATQVLEQFNWKFGNEFWHAVKTKVQRCAQTLRSNSFSARIEQVGMLLGQMSHSPCDYVEN